MYVHIFCISPLLIICKAITMSALISIPHSTLWEPIHVDQKSIGWDYYV